MQIVWPSIVGVGHIISCSLERKRLWMGKIALKPIGICVSAQMNIKMRRVSSRQMMNIIRVCVHFAEQRIIQWSYDSRPSPLVCIVNTLEALFMAKTPLRETSAIITDLRASWTAASRIWAYSSFATGGGKAKVERLFQFQDNALKAVADKAGALGDRIVPGRLGDRIL
jgi:hypothetical protein